MNQNVQAIHENGILRLLQPLDLLEGSIVWIKIIEVLDDSAEFIKGVENNLSELKKSERPQLPNV